MSNGKKQNKNTEGLKAPWKPGQSGNPNGRPKKENTYSDTLREILESKSIKIKYTYTDKNGDTQIKHVQVTSDKNMYHGIAAAQISEALAGNVQAQKEIIDRIQGKAPQGIDITSQGDKINESPLTDKERALLADLLDNADSQ